MATSKTKNATKATPKKVSRKKAVVKKTAVKKAKPKKNNSKADSPLSGIKLFGSDFNALEGVIPTGDIEAFNFVPIIGYAARYNPEMQRGFITIRMAGGQKTFEVDPPSIAASLTMLKSFNCSYNGQYIGFNLL